MYYLCHVIKLITTTKTTTFMATIAADQKKMNKLVKDMDFTTEEQYFDYIVESFTNGQPKQARELFKDMPVEFQKEFLMSDNHHLDMKQVAFLTI